MTDYRATPEQWSEVEGESWNSPRCSCLMELRARVEALEASIAKGSDHIGQVNKMVTDGSLVERVAYAITGDSDGPINWKPEARAAIREVAAWLKENGGLAAQIWSEVIEQEAKQ